jgi:3-hydroxyisobutyrate dehydrogenase
MAGRLYKAGYPMIAFDAAGTEGRAPSGARAAAELEEVAEAEVIFLSLPNGAASKSVCSRIAEVPEHAARIVADLSTIGIPAARECAGILKAAGITYVDAPISGGQRGAIAGTLTLMVAAEEQVLSSIRPLLSTFGKNIFHIGDTPGQGQAMKLINNFLAGAVLAATCEAVVSGMRAGLDLRQMIDVINVSTGSSFMSTHVFPESVFPGTFDTGFSGALLSKDLNLYAESIKTKNIPHEIGDTVVQLWNRFEINNPNTDVSYMFKYLMERSMEVK